METRPNIEETAKLFTGPLGVRSLALTGIFIMGLFYTLYFARDFFLPVMLALLFNFLLSPVVRGLKRAHIPEAVSAALVIALGLAVVGVLGWRLSQPLSDWIARAPEITGKLATQIRKLKKPVEKVTEATQQVEKITATSGPPGSKPPSVEVKQSSVPEKLFYTTWNFLFSAAVCIILLYFLLASGDLFLRKLIKVLPTRADKRRAVEIARDIETNISRYLATVTIINACLGTAGGIALWLLGMPTPFMFGAMAGLFNFVPYLGATTSVIIFTIAATATFPNLGHALLVPGTYLALAVLEGNFITPWIMGRRLTLNPVMIFLSLTFWGWIWGIAGALLAVPLLAMFKIFCDHIEPLAPVGEFLGD